MTSIPEYDDQIIDLGKQTKLSEFSGRYSAANAGDLAAALTAAVSTALRLRGAIGEPIAHAAAAPYWQGLVYLRRDQHSFDQAIPLFRQAIQRDPHSPLPQAGLVEALVLKYGDTKEDRWLAEAGRLLKSAEALNPDSVAVLLAGGRFEASQSHYEKALQNYQRVQEIQPRNVEVLLRIAEIDNKLNMRKEAIKNYRAAILLEPAYYETYEEFGSFITPKASMRKPPNNSAR